MIWEYIAKYLVWNKDGIGVLADVATALGILVAVVGAIVALNTLRSTSRDAERAHMHGLFREYLRLRSDLEMFLDKKGGGGERRTRYEQDLASTKLYAAEEIWGWVERKELETDRFEWLRSKRKTTRERHDQQAWLATILSHVAPRDEQERKTSVEVLLQYHRCYGLGFLRFLAPYLKDPRIDAVIREDERRLAEGKARSHGSEEIPAGVLRASMRRSSRAPLL